MVRTALLTLWLVALSAPAALAAPGQDQGGGWYVPADDKVVTNVGFLLIAGFPVLILLLSLLQGSLDKRRPGAWKRRRRAARAPTFAAAGDSVRAPRQRGAREDRPPRAPQRD